MYRFNGDPQEQLVIDADSGHVVIFTKDCVGSAGVWLDPEVVESVITALTLATKDARHQKINRKKGAMKP